ncbi:acyl-CoA thioesterase-1 [Marivirga sericea]|uniref:Acyl-CoA thioesterase-1 n=1 Tax=Marivirga sericea TaxID=1028 RepID=A0A1X7LEG4_9BACT|nr:arylesterase [Marivirga sericea]SMG52165.1 acyl-CoA thioesterase-1 [Marivirga sericea]
MKINWNQLFAIFFILISACNSNTKQEEETSGKKIDQEVTEKEEEKNNIIFFGNSLTAGYGVEADEAFPGLIQKNLDSLGYDYNVINAGVSGETTASGLSRVEWVVKRQPVEIFILELGGNDGLRGIKPEETNKNLRAIIDKVKEIHPVVKILLAGMMVPPNMGQAYAEEFRKVFPEIAKDKNVNLIPFLLKDVGGEAELNQPDGIHPTPKGHKIVAETVWTHLESLL